MFLHLSYPTTSSTRDRKNISKDLAEQLEFYGFRPTYSKTGNPIMAKNKSSAYLFKRISSLWTSRTRKTAIKLVDLRTSEVNAALIVKFFRDIRNKQKYYLTVESIGLITDIKQLTES